MAMSEGIKNIIAHRYVNLL